MERKERPEREEKLKTGGIVTDGIPVTYKKPARPHGKVYRFFDNFWYHYKWHTVAFLFVALVVLVCTLQMCGREEEGDVTVVMAGPYRFSTEAEGYLPLQNCLATYLPEDYNGNGKKDITVVSYPIYSKEEIEDVESSVDENGQPTGATVDRYSNTEAYDQFISHVQTGSATVLFLSPYLFEELSGRGGCLVDLAELTGGVPTGGITKNGGCLGVRLSETALWRENSAVRNALPEGTVICLMKPTVIGATDDAAYGNAVAYFKKIIE